MNNTCGICQVHGDALQRAELEIARSDLWVLRHHHAPAPLLGWLLLDTVRHCAGPVDFELEEATAWGSVVQRSSQLIRSLTGCDRVYAIAFGEGAQHLHLHLIPRFVTDSETSAWSVADHYRQVSEGRQSAVDHSEVMRFVQRAREFDPLMV